MINKFTQTHDPATPNTGPKEGDIYKIVSLHGKTFTLRYGYYAECDRNNPLCRPIPIYPDFRASPAYNAEGIPFVTEIQDACEHFRGASVKTEDSTCGECVHYRRGSDWIGVCKCEMRREKRAISAE